MSVRHQAVVPINEPCLKPLRGRLRYCSLNLILVYFLCCSLWSLGGPSLEKHDGRQISQVDITADGPITKVSHEDLSKLILLREGEVFTTSKARATISLLHQTGFFFDVQISTHAATSGKVAVQIKLIRLHLVGKISFRGKLGLGQQVLRRELALRGGEAFTAHTFGETTRRLNQLYPKHGFYQAIIQASSQIDSEKARVNVTFEIKVGKRAQIRSLTIDVEGPISPGELASQISSRRGHDYSGIQFQEDIGRLQTYLALKGFFRPEIEGGGETNYDERTNSVALELSVRSGDLTEVVFEGIELSSEELKELPVYRFRNTGEPILIKTANQLKLLLQKQGYLLAQVQSETLQTPSTEPRIVFTVSKGPQYKVGEVLIEGNTSIDSKSLLARSATKKAGTFGRGLLTDETIELDKERLLSAYARTGYLDAVVTHKIREEGDNVRLVYQVTEGPRYIVRSLSFAGNQEVTTERLERFLTMKEDQTFSPSGLAEDRAYLIGLYQDQGFRDVEVTTELSYDDRGTVDLIYSISEGSRFFVDDVVVVGTEKTRRQTVDEQILARKDEPLSLRRNLQSETNLYDLGVFKSVKVAEIPSSVDPAYRTVLFTVDESSRYSITYGVGYNYSYGPSASEGFRGTFGLTNNNFLGRAHTLSFGTRVSSLRQRANVALTMPRFFKLKLPTVISVTASNENRIQTENGEITVKGRPYDSLRYSISTQSEKVLSRRESMFYRYEFASVRNSLPDDPDLPPLEFYREEERLRLSSISASYVNESRVNPLNPTEGFFLSGDAKLTAKILGSERQFIRFLGQGRYYHPLGENLIFASSLRLGIIQPFGNTLEVEEIPDPREDGTDPGEDRTPDPVPISERFFAGGPTTLRGLPLDLAGPLLIDPETGEPVLVNTGGGNLAPVPLGGNVLGVLNLELRFPLFFLFGGNFFYDGGNVFASPTRIAFSKLSHDVGFGLSIRTPIGPFRIDAAYNPNPPDVTGFSKWNFHINFGHPF